MKTIKTTKVDSQYWKRVPVGTLLRVRDEDAKKVVDNHEAQYASREEWKKLRDQEETNDINKEAINA